MVLQLSTLPTWTCDGSWGADAWCTSTRISATGGHPGLTLCCWTASIVPRRMPAGAATVWVSGRRVPGWQVPLAKLTPNILLVIHFTYDQSEKEIHTSSMWRW